MKRLPAFWWFWNRRKRIKMPMQHYSAFARDGSKPHATGGLGGGGGWGGGEGGGGTACSVSILCTSFHCYMYPDSLCGVF